MSDRVVIENGLTKVVHKQGSGEAPKRHAMVKVHYTGRLQGTGEVFDSSRDRQVPFEFRLGEGKVIKGWDKGVATMLPGEVATLVCPPEYAYGKHGSPPKIPGGATLEFEVELLSHTLKQIVTEDGGVEKEVVTEGEGNQRPNFGTRAVVTYSGVAVRPGGDKTALPDFSGEEVEHTVGDGLERLPRGFDEAVLNLRRGETSVFHVAPAYSYTERQNAELAGVPLELTVTLHSFERTPETFELGDEEKVERADALKRHGNALFKLGRTKEAGQFYVRAAQTFSFEHPELDKELKARLQDIKSAAHTNLAACAMRDEDWKQAYESASDALAIVPDNGKALLRRGTALLRRDELEKALEDLVRADEILGGTATTKKLVAQARTRLKALRAKERKLYGNFFSKVDWS